MNRVAYFARTTFRNHGIPFGIKQHDRLHHVYVIGKTGVGKSTLLKTLIAQDIAQGRGCALFDPHGDLALAVHDLCPSERTSDLLYLNVPDTSLRWHFNPLSGIPPAGHALAVASLVEVFRKLWSEEWGPRLEHVLRNVLFTLLSTPRAHLGLIPRLLSDRHYREAAVTRVSNKAVRDFWKSEYDQYSYRFRAVVVAPLQNKVGAFLTDPLLERIITGESSFDLRDVIDQGKILLVNLAKGRIGEGPASLLGSLLVSSLALTALSRADVPEEKRRPFFCYLDEFHTFATLSLASMLSELRKYGLGLVLANQYLSQLDTQVRDAVLGNAGTLISFRVGPRDAPLIARHFEPKFEPLDLIRLPNYHLYLRLMIDGQPSSPFSAETVADLKHLGLSTNNT